MTNIHKAGLFLGSIAFFCLPSFASSMVQMKGNTPPTEPCRAIRLANHHLGMEIIMPDSQYDMPQITSTSGFYFLGPVALKLNNEGVEGSCDYYMNPIKIFIKDEVHTLHRLVINSDYDRRHRVCEHVTVTLSIESDENTCNIRMTE